MPAVLVHGVPETPTVWDPLVVALGRSDTVQLQLPGFGCPLPEGFDATMDRYAAWLAEELAAIDGPIDLVGHDWGGYLSFRVLGTEPDAARSLVSDMGNLTPGFRWHDMARVWQTPGEGEVLIDAWMAMTVDERAAGLRDVGVPHHAAVEMSTHMDATMGEAILALYRSAVDIGAEWGPVLDDITVPTLLVEAVLDGFRRPGSVAELADRIGGERVELPEQGHWWMLDDPTGAAGFLSRFWASVEN
mgnify:CR=1 FL=1